MTRILNAFFVLAIALSLSACGASKSCKDACDKVNTCGLKSSGLSCDASCAAPADGCAVCVNDTSCADILSGKCTASCPGTSFANK